MPVRIFLVGSGGDDIMYGGTENDTMRGKAGNDIMYGEAGVDFMQGFEDDDTLYGGESNDYLYGHSGDDTLFGGDDNDRIFGNEDNDMLYGGDGLDTMFGGTGTDTFVFEDGSAFNDIDVIKDFSTIESDKLDLSDILSAYDPLNDLITDFVQITDNGTNSTLAVDENGGANNFVSIATIEGITGLTDEVALESAGTLITA